MSYRNTLFAQSAENNQFLNQFDKQNQFKCPFKLFQSHKTTLKVFGVTIR